MIDKDVLLSKIDATLKMIEDELLKAQTVVEFLKKHKEEETSL